MLNKKLFFAAVLVALAIGLMLASSTYGTNDILFFKSYAVKVSNSGVADLYREGAPLFEFHTDLSERMAHPPGVIHIWQATLWVEKHTGIPFRTWFRILTVLAHLLTAAALYRILGARAATAFVLCPAAIMVAGFHGNSDPIVVLFLIWAVLGVEEGWRPWLTGLLFAAACSVKVWPLFLIPAFCLQLANWRQRMTFLTAGAAGALVFGAPYTFQFPMLIAQKVFGYRSTGGWWGLSGMVAGYTDFGTALVFAAVLVATVYLHRLGPRFYEVAGGAIAVFLVFTPGFGVQYLAWLLPFCFVLGWRFVAGFYAGSTALLFAAYTHWSGGIPWYFADLLRPGEAQSLVVNYTGTICWIVLVIGTASMTPVFKWALPSGRDAQAA
jgi:hypothetical protein